MSGPEVLPGIEPGNFWIQGRDAVQRATEEQLDAVYSFILIRIVEYFIQLIANNCPQ